MATWSSFLHSTALYRVLSREDLNPSLNGQLHYPTDLDRPLNETVVDKILQYRADYNNGPSHVISFMTAVTSGHLHCKFVLHLFLETYREPDRFLVSLGFHLT